MLFEVQTAVKTRKKRIAHIGGLNSKQRLSYLLLIILLFSLFQSLFAKPAQPEKFRLIHADKLFMSKTYDEQALELSGKVHFFYGSTEFKSDRALILDAKKIARYMAAWWCKTTACLSWQILWLITAFPD